MAEKMIIFTHLNPDLDALASVWAAKRFIPGAKQATIEFRPAEWDGSGMNEGDLALDIRAGGRGLKGEQDQDGTVHSCFAAVVAKYASANDQEALKYLTRYVDAMDAHGRVVKFLAPDVTYENEQALSLTGLNAVLRALQATHRGKDALVLERMSEIFAGMLGAGHARLRAAREADKAELFGDGKVAIVRDASTLATNHILFAERGVRAIIYVDGNNLGVVRNNEEEFRTDHPDLCALVELAGEAGQWYAHPNGFLFCRGSKKSPAKGRSKVSPRALAQAAAQFLQ